MKYIINKDQFDTSLWENLDKESVLYSDRKENSIRVFYYKFSFGDGVWFIFINDLDLRNLYDRMFEPTFSEMYFNSREEAKDNINNFLRIASKLKAFI